jgi:hypothetical protein
MEIMKDISFNVTDQEYRDQVMKAVNDYADLACKEERDRTAKAYGGCDKCSKCGYGLE